MNHNYGKIDYWETINVGIIFFLDLYTYNSTAVANDAQNDVANDAQNDHLCSNYREPCTTHILKHNHRMYAYTWNTLQRYTLV